MRFDDRFRLLTWLSFGQICTMLVFANYQALLPILQKEWALTNGQAGWIYSSYHIGYILSVFILSSLTDYVNPKYIYLITAFWAGISGALFSLLAEGFRSALILRTLMGIGLAGTYMPGLRMVSENFSPEQRGRAVGIYVASFTFGTSLSFFFTGFLNSALSWRWAFLITSLGPIAAGVIASLGMREISWSKAESGKDVSFAEILRNRPVMMMIGGYVCHMWEMFGMRGWMVAFLAACLLAMRYDLSKAVSMSTYITGWATLIGALSNAIGGTLSDRFGRSNTIIIIMLGSGVLSLVIGWTITFPLWIIVVVSLLYGLLIPAESSVISTGVTELAHPWGLGRTMAIQSVLGFGAASISPIIFGYVLDLTNPADALVRFGYFPNWGWAFTLLGLGGLIGPLFIWKMRREGAGYRSFLV
ncbi:MAG TPA: MFS transporter [Thermodesulfobacteriota bacterium]|nr:MFS transporter [Thermodesulfobacteriota bacterium]